MNKKPVLVVMAAGMGSRYGGLKQIDPIGPSGEVIIDYSLYDAKRAGFDTAIFIIKKEIEADFKAIISRGAAKHMNVFYAFQEIGKIPEGFSVPEGRTKPWGTAHAVLAAKDLVDAPFAIVNADDYYGPGAFKVIYDYLATAQDGKTYDYCMAGYRIENTLTENGTVSRGICVTENGYLTHIDERTKVGLREGRIMFSEDGGSSWTEIMPGTAVSMNLFGFTPSIMKEIEDRFPENLQQILDTNPLKGEYYIPILTSQLVAEGKARVKVLQAEDRWFGVTYKEDKPGVVAAIKKKVEEGLYPENLWG